MEHTCSCSQRCRLAGHCRHPAVARPPVQPVKRARLGQRSTRLCAQKVTSDAASVSTEQEQDADSQRKAAEWAALAEGDAEDFDDVGVPDFESKINEICNEGVRIMLSSNLEALGGFKEKLFEWGAIFTDAENKEATMFCYALFRLTEHQVPLAARDLTGNYKEAFEKMFYMLEDSGWQLKMEGEEAPDMLDGELIQPPAESFAQGL